MSHQQDDPTTPHTGRRSRRADVAAAVATRPRRRWIPATAIVGGVLVTAALTGAGIANAADEGGTPTGSPSASASASGLSAGTCRHRTMRPRRHPAVAPYPSRQRTERRRRRRPTGPRPASGAVPPSPPAGAVPPGAAGGRCCGTGRGCRRCRPPAGPAADGSTRVLGVVTAIDDSSITVRTDAGDEVTATLERRHHLPGRSAGPGADPSSAATTKPVVGQRVELRVLDGAVVDAGVVHAHADGTVLSTSGTSAVLVTREGLHVTLDLSATDATVAVGDQVHADGSANSDGTAIVVSSLHTVG